MQNGFRMTKKTKQSFLHTFMAGLTAYLWKGYKIASFCQDRENDTYLHSFFDTLICLKYWVTCSTVHSFIQILGVKRTVKKRKVTDTVDIYR